MPDLWESSHGLDRDDPADAAFDPDRDRLSNLGEYLAATDPNDPASTFLLRSPRWDAGEFTFRSDTVTGRVYRVETRAQGSASSWQETMVAEGTGEEFLFRPPIAPGAGHQFPHSTRTRALNLASLISPQSDELPRVRRMPVDRGHPCNMRRVFPRSLIQPRFPTRIGRVP